MFKPPFGCEVACGATALLSPHGRERSEVRGLARREGVPVAELRGQSLHTAPLPSKGGCAIMLIDRRCIAASGFDTGLLIVLDGELAVPCTRNPL